MITHIRNQAFPIRAEHIAAGPIFVNVIDNLLLNSWIMLFNVLLS
nr:MAG TPA: hypothetical protein [Caudoviricetes sp.]